MATSPADRKVYAFGEEAHAKISEGVRKGAEMVASTLGPNGRNVLIERKHRTPIAVDDGILAIENMILEDDLENLGLTALVDAARKASEQGGDGTSTTVVLTRAVYDEGRKQSGDGMLSFGKSPLEIKNDILSSKDLVISELKAMSKKVTAEEIRAVALSAYADEKMADIVSELINYVGEDGLVIVEEGWGRETEVEKVTGMRFAGKLAHGFFANTPEEGLTLEGLPILVCDFDFVNLNDISAIVKDTAQAGEAGLIVIANKYERAAIEQVIRSNMGNAQNRNPFRIHLVKTPSLTPSEFEDVATFLGAKYFSKERGEKVLQAQLTDLGRSSVFKISKNGDGIALGGQGTPEAVKARIEELKENMEKEKVKMFKGRIEQRIASLASAIGIIKVASPSEGETEHIRLKVRNAVKSAQAAVSEGIVKGGGQALKEIAEKLPEGSILKEALKVPYETIQRNSGGKLTLEGIYDATKITRTSLEQACSTAWLLINTGTAIAFRSEPDRGDAARIIADKK